MEGQVGKQAKRVEEEEGEQKGLLGGHQKSKEGLEAETWQRGEQAEALLG